MIATVTLNPCLDKNITVRELVVDEANRWTSLRRDPGGKGIMASRAIHQMGGNTTAYGFIGGHDGRMVEILLDEEGVHCDFTPIANDIRTNFIVTDTKTRQQTRIDAPGPHISKADLKRLKRKLREIRPQPDFMILAGSAPPGVPDDIYAQLIEEAKAKGIKTILDSDGEWLKRGIETKPYLIKPNVSEAERLLGTELSPERAVVEAARRLVEIGIEAVVISRGKQGMIAATRNEVLKVSSPQLKARSTVGAGDCTIAGLALGLSRGESFAQACRMAGAMGAAAVLTPGTTPCRRGDVERLLKRTEVRKIS
jgi:6-phosphofructokinase 2